MFARRCQIAKRHFHVLKGTVSVCGLLSPGPGVLLVGFWSRLAKQFVVLTRIFFGGVNFLLEFRYFGNAGSCQTTYCPSVGMKKENKFRVVPTILANMIVAFQTPYWGYQRADAFGFGEVSTSVRR